jgi:ABC-type transport system involved in multi-copper enzyme maturation permease subunit
MPALPSTLVGLRRLLGGTSPRQFLGEGLGGILLAAAAAWMLWFGGRLAVSHQVGLWGLLLIALAVVLRRGWLKLLGPVLFYDLVLIARRSRYALLRCLYALFLLLMLYGSYQSYRRPLLSSVDPRMLAQMSESFFLTLLGVQFFAVLVLTPAYTAGAIAEEKERRTLEFLLATDLHNREIVLSKQLARLANLVLLVLTGLPILSLMQFLGGVDPDLVLAGFAATGLTMVGLGSLSILCSVYARKASNGIVLTYLAMVAYVGVSGITSMALAYNPELAGQPLTFGSEPITVQDAADWVTSGNPFRALVTVLSALRSQQNLANVLPDLLTDYALFYGIVTAVCTGWAVWRLRAVALRQNATASTRLRGRGWPGRSHAIGVNPMVWKEVHTERGLQLNWFGRTVICLVVASSFAPIIIMAIEYSARTRLDEWAVNAWVRGVGTLVACLTLLGVAVRAAGSISGERARQTFDSLLTSPLTNSEIVYGKWACSMLSIRWGWAWLATIWAVGVALGGLSVWAIPFLAAAWFVYASFVALLGLWLSVGARSTRAATVSTLAAAAVLAFGHWLPWICCLFGGGADVREILEFQTFALTPPATLGFLAFRGDEFAMSSRSWGAPEMFTFCVVGLCLWGIASFILWGMTCQRFSLMTHRDENKVPRRSNAPALAEVIDLNGSDES